MKSVAALEREHEKARARANKLEREIHVAVEAIGERVWSRLTSAEKDAIAWCINKQVSFTYKR